MLIGPRKARIHVDEKQTHAHPHGISRDDESVYLKRSYISMPGTTAESLGRGRDATDTPGIHAAGS
ncbi:hypothetical protein [Burkholderia sp. S171]|uniref:hypothetical protein n=1 Tax=Burkholderia sp. S171 TaxID=1641860 RepID=UPI00131DB104|nr:hypothetical protein [Burkholderia sp. S171]